MNSASASLGCTREKGGMTDVIVEIPVTPSPTHSREHSINACPAGQHDCLHSPSSAHSHHEALVPANVESAYQRKTGLRTLSACFAFFVCGWGDGVTGTILPHIKSDFNLSYMTSALLFVTSIIGFASGVMLIGHAMSWLGRAPLLSLKRVLDPARNPKLRRWNTESTLVAGSRRAGSSPSQARCCILTIASILHAGFYILMGSSLGFKAILAAYAIASFARANLTGVLNAYVSAAPKSPLGQLHACWAFGAFVAPFVCQTLLAEGVPWRFFYIGSLAFSGLNTAFIAYAYWPTNEELCEEERMHVQSMQDCSSALNSPAASSSPATFDDEKLSKASSLEASGTSNSGLISVISFGYVWAFCFFAWVYSGSETTTHGYMATYLLTVRHANPKTAGYVTSGFWAGMAISRYTFGVYATRYDYIYSTEIFYACSIWYAELCVSLYNRSEKALAAIGLTMHLFIWFINSTVLNMISTAIIGLVYGPVFPGMLSLLVELLPKRIHVIAMSVICGFANMGGSIFPFITGVLANSRGPRVLTYVTVAQTSTLILIWFLFPSKPVPMSRNSATV